MIAETLRKNNYATILLYCKPAVSARIVSAIMQKKINIRILAPLSVLNENELTDDELELLDKLLYFPSFQWNEKELSVFRIKYFQIFSKSPGLVAAYAFDAMNILIQALKSAGGPDREKIQKALSV